jgi:hypothetical protein
MPTQIDQFDCYRGTGKCGFLDQLWRTNYRDHRPMVVRICGPIEHFSAPAPHCFNDRANDRQVTAFTEVGHRLQDRGGHGVEDKDEGVISQAKKRAYLAATRR